MTESRSDDTRTAPRSVRDGLAPPTQATPEIETPTRTLQVEGSAKGEEEGVVEWMVTEVGRAEAGTGGPMVPLLLVVFQRVGEATDAKLEGMIVGRDLESVPEDALRVALSRARPWRPPDETPPFFADSHQPGGS